MKQLTVAFSTFCAVVMFGVVMVALALWASPVWLGIVSDTEPRITS